MRLLLEHGADVEGEEYGGQTALQVVCKAVINLDQGRCDEIVRLLLEYNAK